MSFINNTVFHSTELAQNGTPTSPLKLAQQGAAVGQVLSWNGTQWAPSSNTASKVIVLIDNGDSPYTITNEDIVLVDTSTGAVTVNMPSSITSGREVTIKDYSALANTNNITISGNGNNIVGETDAASQVINTDGTAFDIIGYGTKWAII